VPISNHILWWIAVIILAYLYGLLVQYVLGYDRNNIFRTLSIGAIGILLGSVTPRALNLSKYLNIGGVPLFSSLVGSFIIPGIMWFLRREKPRKGPD
jgi:uncharacterized membrane protein YeaQ/YmgE (transglycosylase-associated protein family)